ncbi:MAG: 30S ribosomal protein S18 [Bacilli bacterium]|jgi:small subunit ribosomal protein S18|nr:30S ribosomal protein S18 [Bacilli bacterium]MBR4830919.1 30S ribosomal protein S18 [Bacilli bacterium]
MAEFKPRRRKKVCAMCEGHVLDYKNAEDLKKYINEKGKILPRRVTGTCAKHQREVAKQIKRARMIALLPFTK